MVENSKIGRIIFFRIRSSTGYKISENLDRISARRKLCGDSVPCIIWTDALECMDCRTGMWNCISHDIEMVTGGNRVQGDSWMILNMGYFSRDLESAWNADACISCGCDGAGAGLWSGKWKRTTRMSFYPFLLLGYLGTFIW